MTAAERPGSGRPVPDPWKGLRAVMAAILILESLAALLALLVVTKVGDNGGPLGVMVVLVLALALIAAARFLARSWGLALVVALQIAMAASGLLVTALGMLAVVFGLVWAAILLMRRDVARKMARGELPGQQA